MRICNATVSILVRLPVGEEVLMTSIAHANGILPVSRDNVVMLGAGPAHDSTTAPTVMSAIELNRGRKQNTCLAQLSDASPSRSHFIASSGNV